MLAIVHIPPHTPHTHTQNNKPDLVTYTYNSSTRKTRQKKLLNLRSHSKVSSQTKGKKENASAEAGWLAIHFSN